MKALSRWRKKIRLVGIDACPLAEWLYGALTDSGIVTVCIEALNVARHGFVACQGAQIQNRVVGAIEVAIDCQLQAE
jgi:hypothetical protein